MFQIFEINGLDKLYLVNADSKAKLYYELKSSRGDKLRYGLEDQPKKNILSLLN